VSRPPWAGSTRRARLPANWSTPGGLRDQVFGQPDGRACRLRYEGCTAYATEVDHIERGDDHRLGNLQPACKACHRIKSAREGAAGQVTLRRPPETHPSLQ
jgi:5-methylcytosine-specific restriction protein A